MAKMLAEKFFIKPGYNIAVLNAPENYLADTLIDLPADVTITATHDNPVDHIQYFVSLEADLVPQINALKAGVIAGGVLWLCYPKGGKKARIATDLNRDILWELMEKYGLTPNHQIAIDETWSAVRFKLMV